MQAERLVHPELHGKRSDTVAVPVRGTRDGTDGKAGRLFRHGLPEGLATGHGAGLLAGPCPNAAGTGTGLEIGISLFIRKT